jgi:hypothetical protein
MIQRYFDFLTQEKYNQLTKIVEKLQWNYAGFSTNESNANKFWYSELMGHTFFTEWLSEIEKLSNKKFKIDRLYANGQTLGQDGSWHFDSYNNETGYTFLYYFNDFDDVSSIGETYFMVDGEPVAITPIPNSAVLFHHKYKHKGMAPRKGYNDLRVTIAIKLTEITNT